MNRLAIISTHPIQYNAPIFSLLAKEIDLKVFYTWSQKAHDSYDSDFGIKINWDIPFLEGYDYTFSKNMAKDAGAHHFAGIECPNLVKEIETWEATHLLVFGWNYKAHLNVIRHFKGKIPVWFRGDSTLLDEQFNLKTIARRVFLKWVYSHVSKAFYVGKNNYDYYIKHGLRTSQLVYTPHAIDNHRFSQPDTKYEIKAAEWREQLNINTSDLVFLYSGKFEPRKNLPFFLSSIIEYIESSKKRSIKLILQGSGPQEKLLKKLAENHPQILFLPFQNQTQMPVVYRLADIFCLPSKSETWGLAVNEAMACGRPVLVSDKVGCAVDLINENSGCIFKSGDKRSLFGSLDSIIERETKPDGYNSNVIKSHISNWSYNSIINQIVSQLNE